MRLPVRDVDDSAETHVDARGVERGSHQDENRRQRVHCDAPVGALLRSDGSLGATLEPPGGTANGDGDELLTKA